MIDIDFLQYQSLLRIRKEGEQRYLFDPIRKNWLVLQPEELVRQLVLQYLLTEKAYLSTHIKTETGIKVHEMAKRCDIVVFDRSVQPYLLVECKSPKVKLGESAIWQAVNYNRVLGAQYLLVTNGLKTWCCKIDYEDGQHQFLDTIPEFAG